MRYRKLTFTNSQGESITLGKGTPYLIESLEGTGGAPVTHHTHKAPFQDGTTYNNTVLEPRELALECAFRTLNAQERIRMRRELSRVLNPKLGLGMIHLDYDGGHREIVGIVENGPTYADRGNNPFQKFILTFYCPNPYWLGASDTVEELAVYEGGFKFILKLPTKFATITNSKTKMFTNGGDVPTPLNITFTGPAEKPIRVANDTTGEFVEVNEALKENERLVITTEFGKKTVTKIDADGKEYNAFHLINLNSSFFKLQPGPNKITYSTGFEYEQAPVSLRWRERYYSI